MTLTEEVIIEEIWKNPGINSHSLLVRLVVKGYKYNESGNDSYLYLLQRIRNRKDVRYVESGDKYYVSKNITIEIPLESFSFRHNCYSCDFMKQIEDNPEMRNSSKYAGKDTYCALDKNIAFKQSVLCLNKGQCPLNKEIEKILGGK